MHAKRTSSVTVCLVNDLFLGVDIKSRGMSLTPIQVSALSLFGEFACFLIVESHAAKINRVCYCCAVGFVGALLTG